MFTIIEIFTLFIVFPITWFNMVGPKNNGSFMLLSGNQTFCVSDLYFSLYVSGKTLLFMDFSPKF